MVSDPSALDGILSVSRTETRIGDAPALARAAGQFSSRHVVVLKQCLSPALVAWTQAHVRAGAFRLKVHPASGVEECMANDEAIWLLRFLLGDARVLRAVEAVTGVTGLTKCQVRIYRFVPQSGQHHDWHDDIGEGRQLGLSINVSEAPFEGGHLQLRERDSGRITADVRNTGSGDAAIFRLAPGLQHQVLPVTGDHPRVAVAGWFRTD